MMGMRLMFVGCIALYLQVWADIIVKAKEGGLDVIETYVFWNYHEPVKGQVQYWICIY